MVLVVGLAAVLGGGCLLCLGLLGGETRVVVVGAGKVSALLYGVEHLLGLGLLTPPVWQLVGVPVNGTSGGGP